MTEINVGSPELPPSQQLQQYIDSLVAEQAQPGDPNTPIIRYHFGRAEDTITITPDEQDQGYYITWNMRAKPSNKPFACFTANGEIKGLLPRDGVFTFLHEDDSPSRYDESMAARYVNDVLPFCTNKPRWWLGRILFEKFGI